MRRIQHIHFIGIGGVGMSGIAEVLLNEGYVISGSDMSSNPVTQRLEQLGATVFPDHHADNIKAADVIVTSTAIQASNPEVMAAKEQRIPIVRRAEMLAELMRYRKGIAVSGTHGKTTTTSLVSTLLAEGGQDPTYVIGGILNSAGSNACLGTGEYLVAEADESDASFLYLKPLITIVTNIDHDHLETYEGDFQKLRQTFIDFLHHLPFHGLAVLCVDDLDVKSILPEVSRPMITYGFDSEADVRATHYQQRGMTSCFTVESEQHAPMTIELNLPGKHNVLNALAAIIVARESGVKDAVIQNTLKHFQGIGRRFQCHELTLDDKAITVVDDYGHHPAEVAATLETVRAVWPDRRVVLAFQPHRYSRTRDLFDDFVAVLSQPDQLFLLDVYPAGEAPIPSADGPALARAIRERGQLEPIFIKQLDEFSDLLLRALKPQDVVVMQGAGSVSKLVKQLLLCPML